MNRSVLDQQLLFVWSPWEQLPDAVRQQVIDVLAAAYLEILDLSHKESDSDDANDH